MSLLRRIALAIPLAVVAVPSIGMTQGAAAVQGEWSLNRDLTPAPPRGDDDGRRPVGRRPPGGGGRGGFGGGLGAGTPGGRRGPSDTDMRKFDTVRRRIEEVPQRLVIAIDGARVQLVDEIGRATTLVADGKKQDRLTGDGEFKSTTRLDSGKLVVEEDFDGPKVTTTYERVTGDGPSRLRVTLQVEGMPRGRGGRDDQSGKVSVTRIYDARPPAP